MPLPHRSKMNIEYTKVSVPKQLCRYHHSLLNKPPWAVISEDYGMNTLQDYVAIKTGGCATAECVEPACPDRLTAHFAITETSLTGD
jgi:hypothetical protein